MVEKEVLDCMEVLIKKVMKNEYNRKYRLKNKEIYKQKRKIYLLNNKEKVNKKRKEYLQSESGLKSTRISNWKRHGIITDDYEALYDHYTKTSYCDFCRVELTYDKKTTATTKCVDHDHTITDAPNFRNILCNLCNLKRK
tara:strand:+ start:202 stop:621 length:420 start_codon:yes stop_codon:yes gene_type:complete